MAEPMIKNAPAPEGITKVLVLTGPSAVIHYGGQDYRFKGGQATVNELLEQWGGILDELEIHDPVKQRQHVMGIIRHSETLAAQTGGGAAVLYPAIKVLYLDEAGEQKFLKRGEGDAVEVVDAPKAHVKAAKMPVAPPTGGVAKATAVPTSPPAAKGKAKAKK